MTSSEKSTGLLAVLAKSLTVYGHAQTQVHLGDRSTYIGLSDIGKGDECLRSAVASKLAPAKATGAEQFNARSDLNAIMPVLRKQLTLQRGHWQEAGIENALNHSGYKIIPQLTIKVKYQDVPIQAHLDLTMIVGGNNPAVRVLELKCNEKLQNTLYASNELQICGQVGFLFHCWNKPCFSLKDANGKDLFEGFTFPQVTECLFGIAMPENPDEVSIEGWVTSLAFSDANVFGPYLANDTMMRVVLNTAVAIWTEVQSVRSGAKTLNEVAHARGFYPLCDWCEHIHDCPRFTASAFADDPQTEADLEKLMLLKEQANSLKCEIDLLESSIKNAYSQTNQSGNIEAGMFRFRVGYTNGRRTLDQNLLVQELESLGLTFEDVQGVVSRSTKVGNGYERLFINRVTPSRAVPDCHVA